MKLSTVIWLTIIAIYTYIELFLVFS